MEKMVDVESTWIEVFSWLDLEDLAVCKRVCKAWNAIGNREEYYQRFYQKLNGRFQLKESWQDNLKFSLGLEAIRRVFNFEESLEDIYNLKRCYLILSYFRLSESGVPTKSIRNGSSCLDKLENLTIIRKSGINVLKLWALVLHLPSIKKLYLEYYQLFEVPEPFGNLTTLTTLSLERSDINKLPDSFKNLVNLKWLNLGENSFVKFPEVLHYLVNLKWVNIGSNCIDSKDEKSFKIPPDLRVLFLRWNFLGIFPGIVSEDDLQSLNLRELTLSNNNIQKLPDSLANLVKLRKLSLRLCILGEVPSSICNRLTNLESLDLSRNLIESLPEAFGNLINLRRLFLRKNFLKRLPDSFTNLVNLRILHLEHNHIEKLPNDFGTLTKLFRLGLSWNKIKKLPDSFGKLNNLKQFCIGNNRLEDLPDSFVELPELQDADFRNNKFKEIPECISVMLANSTTLGVRFGGNPVEKIPFELTVLGGFSI